MTTPSIPTINYFLIFIVIFSQCLELQASPSPNSPPPTCIQDESIINITGLNCLLYRSEGPISLTIHIPVGSLNEGRNEELGAAQHIAQLVKDHCHSASVPINVEILPQSTLYSIDNILPENIEDTLSIIIRVLTNLNSYDTSLELISGEKKSNNAHSRSSIEAYPLPKLNSSSNEASYKSTFCLPSTIAHFYTRYYQIDQMTLILVGELNAANIEDQLFDLLEKLPEFDDKIYASDYKFAENSFFSETDPNSDPIKIQVQHDESSNEIHFFLETLSKIPQESLKNPQTRLAYLVQKRLEGAFLNALGESFFLNKASFPQYHFFYEEPLQYQARWTIDFHSTPSNWKTDLSQLGELFTHTLYNRHSQSIAFKKAHLFVQDILDNAKHTLCKGNNREKSTLLLSFFTKGLSELKPYEVLCMAEEMLAQISLKQCIRNIEALWELGPNNIFAEGQLPYDSPKEFKENIQNTYLEIISEPILAEYKKEKPFKYHYFGKLGNLQQQHYCFSKYGICQFQFENHLKLNIATKDQIHNSLVALKLGNGFSGAEPTKPGLIHLLENAFLPMGLGKHTWSEILQYMEQHHIKLRFEAQPAHFLMIGEAPKAQLKPLLCLMAAYIQDPGFRQEALAPIKETLIQKIKNPKTALESLMQRLQSLTHGDDPRFHLPSEEGLEEWSAHHLKSALLSDIQNAEVELSIIGDYFNSPDTSLTLYSYILKPVAETLGALPIKIIRSSQEFGPPRLFPPTDPIEHYCRHPAINKALTCLYWKTSDDKDPEMSRPLRILARLYQNLLRNRLYEEHGKLYEVHNFAQGGIHPDKGIIAVYVEAAAEEIEKITSSMLMLNKDLVNATRVRKSVFEMIVSELIDQFEQELRELLESKTWDSSLQEHINDRLSILLESTRHIVNTEGLSTEELKVALQGHLESIHYGISKLIASDTESYLYNSLQERTYMLAEALQQENIQNGKNILDLESLNKIEEEITAHLEQSNQLMGKIITLYCELSYKAFIMKHQIMNLLAKNASQFENNFYIESIQRKLDSLQNHFSKTSIEELLSSLCLETDLRTALHTTECLENDCMCLSPPLISLERKVQSFKNLLNKSLLKSRELNNKILEKRNRITELKMQLAAFIKHTQSSQVLTEDIDEWFTTLDLLAENKFAYTLLNNSKTNIIWNSWRLLNPHFPSYGKINSKENAIADAVRDEIASINQELLDPEYWLKQVLVDSQNHLDHVFFTNSFLDDYQKTQINEIATLIRVFLNPANTYQIQILPKSQE